MRHKGTKALYLPYLNTYLWLMVWLYFTSFDAINTAKTNTPARLATPDNHSNPAAVPIKSLSLVIRIPSSFLAL
jgi:hypothetical protein